MLTPKDDLSAALAIASPGSVLELSEGTFRCKLLITGDRITLRGQGADKTRIVYGDYAKKPDFAGTEYNTFRTWTVAVCADDVTISDLSIVNDSLHPEVRGQEVALSVYGDRFTMERCTLSSTQDTLFLGPLPPDLIERYRDFLPVLLRQDKAGRQVFRSCLIEGTVDFIFGCGEAEFEDCELRSLVDARGHGFIAAPAHTLAQERGFVFRRCRLTAQEGVAPGSVYLARPWRDYGLCEFEDCDIQDSHIAAEGFDKWNDTARDKTARFYETPLLPGRVSWARTRR